MTFIRKRTWVEHQGWWRYSKWHWLASPWMTRCGIEVEDEDDWSMYDRRVLPQPSERCLHCARRTKP